MDGRRMKMFKGRSETTQNGTAHTYRHGLRHRHRHRHTHTHTHTHGVRLIQSLMNRDARNEYGVATVSRIDKIIGLFMISNETHEEICSDVKRDIYIQNETQQETCIDVKRDLY